MKQYYVCFSIFVLVGIFTRVQGLSVCPSREISIPADDKTVTSPGYTDDEEYGLDINCKLTITTDPWKIFKVNLIDLDVTPNEDADRPSHPGEYFKCADNKVVIDLGNEKHTRCGKLFNGEQQTFVSTGNKLVIHFLTQKEEFVFREYTGGFLLSYSTEEVQVEGESICPGRHIKKKRSGTLFSPGFPSNYGDNLNCRVKVPIPDNFQMNVWFSDFSLQNSPTCRNDWLSVKDEHGGHRMCGGGPNRIPPFQELKASLARFHFVSDSSLTKKGFRLHYNMTRLQEAHCRCSFGTSYISIMNFNNKVRRLWHRIKFTIKTTQANALIIFSKGNLRDYICIGIRDGKVFYRSDLGTGSTFVAANGEIVNDGIWHNVEIMRRKRSLIVTVDNGRAEASSKTQGNFIKIDLPGSIGYILGTPPQLKLDLPNFIGCIRDFTIDGREPLTNAFVSKPDYPSHGMQQMRQC